MNWNILFLFVMYGPLSVSPCKDWSCLKIFKKNKGKKVPTINDASIQESRNSYLWKAELTMEMVYDKELVSLMNHVKTFDTVHDVFDESDVQFLMVDCKTDDKCLMTKKKKVKRYNRKIQGIQCLNGLYVMSVVDGLDELTNNGAMREAFNEKTKDYLVYMSRMLSLTHKAKWVAYPWLIGAFIFLDGFVNSEAMDEMYKDRLNAFTVNVKQDLEVFIDACRDEGYLPSGNNTTDVGLVVKTLYGNNELKQVFSLDEQFTTKNLMMYHLYEGKKIVYGKTHGIDLKWVDFSLNLYNRAVVNKHMYSIHKWELDLFDNLTYHKLFSAYLHVQTLYYVWLHVKTNLTILTSLKASCTGKSEFKLYQTLYSSWYSLADPLREAMTVFGLQDGIYWTVLRGLMDEPNEKELGDWEMKARQTFLVIAERLKLGNVANINERLLYVGASADSENNLTLIANNVEELNKFTVHIQEILKPIDVWFVKMLTNAKTNLTFYSRGNFKNYR
ncbi:uncharacterized protein LOC126844821 [Adelges cooleyi]|uniref:uncharacterized protein LOC126844821 n=1 Tax=Adelges cooleyi TaxID=133065 RepID=UPI0021803523|nr:uncharacterized protein LOC126844821 [Adelges cooleyi]